MIDILRDPGEKVTCLKLNPTVAMLCVCFIFFLIGKWTSCSLPLHYAPREILWGSIILGVFYQGKCFVIAYCFNSYAILYDLQKIRSYIFSLLVMLGVEMPLNIGHHYLISIVYMGEGFFISKECGVLSFAIGS